MSAITEDLQQRIANSQGVVAREVFTEAMKAVAEFEEKTEKFIEGYGTTVDADDDEWRKLTGNSHRDLSPMTQQRMQSLALYLWESNLLANRIVEVPLAYLLAEGVRVVADNEVIQEYIDRFWNDPINNMDIKLIKKARELSLFGEQCWPTFVNPRNGHVRLGYLDPSHIETVVTDPDNIEQPIGVVTAKNKKGVARRYKIIVNGAEDDLFSQRTRQIRESFADGECFYFNVNSLSTSTRGRSDLLSQIDWLDGYDQFLFGEMDRNQFLRAFIWDVTLKNATPDEVKERARQITPPSPGSTRVHNDSEIWKAETPSLNAADTSESARLLRNHVLGGATQPEHWFGGGGDVNRATASEMGEPTFKVMTMRQTHLGYMLSEVIRYAIRQREIKVMNSEPDLFDSVYHFEIQWPEMVSKDISKYATALTQVTMAVAQIITMGVMTKARATQIIEKITARLGVEFDVDAELADALTELANNEAADAFNNLPVDGNAGE